MADGTMRCVVFRGPHDVAVERRPIPKIRNSTDIVVKVRHAALCGSELHFYRGHAPCGSGFIMGHEFTGRVTETGSSVKTVSKGDFIVSPFTISCGHDCFYCKLGLSSRCEKSLLFGTKSLDGGQAEYVRVPLADGTVVKAPEGIGEVCLCLMADIWPTGYFAAERAFADVTVGQVSQCAVLVIGCGPVGLCALINALDRKPGHVLAVDGVQSRLDLAQSLGAEAWNVRTDWEGLVARVKNLTGGRGADTVIEAVGSTSALQTAFDLLRPWGTISSIGAHNNEIPWTASQAYDKNLTVKMGRCPVRSIFQPALEKLKQTQELLGFMADHIMPLSRAPEGYELFNDMKVQKVVFQADQ